MKYYLFQFKFKTPVHFGIAEFGRNLGLVSLNCGADTFVSALMDELASMDDSIFQSLLRKLQFGSVVFSDLLPYYIDDRGESEFYIPVPLRRINDSVITEEHRYSFSELCYLHAEERKQEQMVFVRASNLAQYLAAQKTGQIYKPEEHEFGWFGMQKRLNSRKQGNEVYFLGYYQFTANAGLYCVGLEDENDAIKLERYFCLLGLEGIGGKKSSGMGKFELLDSMIEMDEYGVFEDDKALYSLLQDTTSPWQMNISVVSPGPGDAAIVKAGTYKLIKRSGFVFNEITKSYQKRGNIYMLRAGSCLPERVKGRFIKLYDKAEAGHDVYRYAKGMYVGLPL